MRTAPGGRLVVEHGAEDLLDRVAAVLARRRPAVAGWGRLALATGVAGAAVLAALPALHQAPRLLSIPFAITGMALTGAALGLSMQAYTLIAQGRARPDQIGAVMGALTFARQLGGSLGTAAFGWLLLTVPASRTGVTLVMAVAALCLLAALLTAPRPQDDAALSP